MILQDKLNALKADFEGGKFPLIPTSADLETMSRATADLIASGQARRAVSAGDKAPEFMLNDPDGKQIGSRSLLEQGPLVISFYRGVWCPYCNLELQALEAVLPEFEARGASLVAISPQTASNSRKSQRDNKLNFPILSDPRSDVAAAFGIRFALPDDLIKIYMRFGSNLPQINNDPSWVLPMPARFVIGIDGVVAYAEINPDYTHRPDPAELLAVLDNLRRNTAA